MKSSIGFTEKLLACAEKNNSWLCIGLDPDVERLPVGIERSAAGLAAFNRAIIEATSDLACAYKPNMAFYEAYGRAGWEALEATIAAIPRHIPIILDAKRGDIGSTAAMYARALFETLGADAATVNPLLGTDSLTPFLEHKDKAIFALCLTSNPGAAEFQVKNGLHLQVARMCAEWTKINRHVGLVAGATRAEALAEIRALAPDRVFLVPGVGAQGGALEETIRAGRAADATRLIINVSRAVIFASSDADFASAARCAAMAFQQRISEAEAAIKYEWK